MSLSNEFSYFNMSKLIKNTIITNEASLSIYKAIGVDRVVSALKSSFTGIEIIELNSNRVLYSLSSAHELNDVMVFNDNNSVAFITTSARTSCVKVWHFNTHKRAKVIFKDSYRVDNIRRIVGSKGKEYIGIYSHLFDLKVLDPENGKLVAIIRDDKRNNNYYRLSQLDNGNLTCYATQPGLGVSNDVFLYTFALNGQIINEQTVGTTDFGETNSNLVCGGGYIGRNLFAIGYYTGQVGLWDISDTKEPVYIIDNNDENVVDQIERISDTLFASSSGDKVNIWCHDTLTIVETISLEGGSIQIRALGENRLAMSSSKENVKVVEFE